MSAAKRERREWRMGEIVGDKVYINECFVDSVVGSVCRVQPHRRGWVRVWARGSFRWVEKWGAF